VAKKTLEEGALFDGEHQLEVSGVEQLHTDEVHEL